MDTEFARTFLTIARTGSFVSAAEQLHVTQSTVSARIRTLERQLGRTLFVRNKNGATLTAVGRRFQKHAMVLVRAVEQARHDVGLPSGFRASLVVGGRIGLWDGLLLDWLADMRRRDPELSIRAEIGFEADLMQGVIDGRIDLAVMYTPQRRPNLELTFLLEERLTLVERPGRDGEAGDYVYVDWGPEFYAQHSAAYPEAVTAPVTVNIGWLGLRHLLSHGGSGYFPYRLVAAHVESGRLTVVEDAPVFTTPAWIVHPSDRDPALVGPVVEALLARAGAEAHIPRSIS